MGDLFVSVYRRDSVDDPVGFVTTLADLAVAQRISGRFGLYLSPAASTCTRRMTPWRKRRR